MRKIFSSLEIFRSEPLNVRSKALNGRSKTLNVHSKPLNGKFP